MDNAEEASDAVLLIQNQVFVFFVDCIEILKMPFQVVKTKWAKGNYLQSILLDKLQHSRNWPGSDSLASQRGRHFCVDQANGTFRPLV